MSKEEKVVRDWFKTNSWDETVSDENIKELLDDLKKAREPNKAPYCHSEPMQKCEKYLGTGGGLVQVYRCNYCHRKQEVILV